METDMSWLCEYTEECGRYRHLKEIEVKEEVRGFLYSIIGFRACSSPNLTVRCPVFNVLKDGQPGLNALLEKKAENADRQ